MNISIIIITHNREKLVKRCIDSVLKACETYKDEVEILVVNSSRELVAKEYGEKVKEIHVPEEPKPYKKRNIGLEASSYEWLLYLDDDCIVDVNILNILKENVLQANDKVGGFYGVTEFIGDTTYASRCCRNSNFTYIFQEPYHKKELAWGVAVSPLFRKKALVQCNGFTVAFTSPVGGEDLDLGVKLNEAGWKLLGIPKILSYHEYETWNSYVGNLKRFFRYGMAETSVVLNHPNHIFFKLNCLTLLNLPILIDLIANYQSIGQVLGKIGLYFGITTIGSAIYYVFQNKIPFHYALGLVIYDRAFELGVIRSSVEIHKLKTLFYRFEYQKKKRLFGNNKSRNILIVVEWLSILLSFLISYFIWK